MTKTNTKEMKQPAGNLKPDIKTMTNKNAFLKRSFLEKNEK